MAAHLFPMPGDQRNSLIDRLRWRVSLLLTVETFLEIEDEIVGLRSQSIGRLCICGIIVDLVGSEGSNLPLYRCQHKPGQDILAISGD